jgi:tRNA(Ile)-lysidine synthetase-like protein
MFRLACDIPSTDFYLACSGGVDSMVALDFMLRGKKRPTLIHINHGTEHARDAEEFIRNRAQELGLKLIVHKLSLKNNKQISQEEFWRTERYRVFHSLVAPVVTAHHLDDAVEWYIFSSLHGKAKLTPIKNRNVIRPFLFSTKKDIRTWAENKSIKYVEDPSNSSLDYMRNVIRHDILPRALVVNPGIHKTVRKLYGT